jgi:hypothetical protein
MRAIIDLFWVCFFVSLLLACLFFSFRFVVVLMKFAVFRTWLSCLVLAGHCFAVLKKRGRTITGGADVLDPSMTLLWACGCMDSRHGSAWAYR